MKKSLLFFIGFIAIAALTYGQRLDRSKFVRDSLDEYINRALTNWRVPGAAVCIIKDGKLVLLKAYGIKELGDPAKVDVNTLFMIGSNTKAFTATALAMLQSANKLSLDDRVTKYLPRFKLDDKLAGEEAIIKDLLCHRLGFKTFEGDFTFYNTNLSQNEIIEKLGRMKAVYPFRTKWGYTNSAFLVAGEIVPKVTGLPWELYLKQNIFAPLGMTNTLALSADLPKSLNRTVPHTLVDGRLTPIPYPQTDGLAPAMSISSSINDMSKWILALLSDGKVGQRQVIPLSAIQATREIQDIVNTTRHANGEPDYEFYGLGWSIQDYAGRHIFTHSGEVSGYLSSVTLVPQEHLGIVILTNTDQNGFYEALRLEVMDAYFKRPFHNYNELYLNNYKANTFIQQGADKRRRDTIALNPLPALPVANYIGKYTNDFYGSVTITQGENNDLEMRFEHHPKMYARLQPLGGNRFYATFSEPIFGKAVFPFTVQNGRVVSVKVKVDDDVESDPYEFKK